jgi:hypothetical protein
MAAGAMVRKASALLMAMAGATPMPLARMPSRGSGLLGRPASESGRLCHGDGGHEGGDRYRRVANVGYPL